MIQEIVISSLIVASYIGINLWVAIRISNAEYQDDSRKKLHKRFIWFLPFIGPLLIRGYWKKNQVGKLEVHTKDKKKGTDQGGAAGNSVPGY